MQIDIGKTNAGKTIALPLRFANRHGLVTGATGTGKTVTLQRLAEQFSAAGVPVFAADVKGDLSGIATASPVKLWDVFGAKGYPIKTSVQEMGAVLLSRMLNLNETQAGTLAIALKKAEDDQNYLLGLDDLRWALVEMQDEREEVCQKYGNVTAASIATIQRNILTLESQGGENLFGEPPFDIVQLLEQRDGRGVVSLLHADQLMEAPKLYGTLIYWLLTELFRKLPEVGDLDKPKLVFFFDEAHLLFRDAPKNLVDSVERVVRLVRSKGVGVYFVTQSPADVPDGVLAQLGNRIQHALRAYTPKEQRFVKAAARAFRPNPAIDVEKAVLEMGVGEALVSTLIADGVPSPVERVKIAKPNGQIGPISDEEREVVNGVLPAQRPDQARQFENRQRVARGLDAVPVATGEAVDLEFVLAPLYGAPAARRPIMPRLMFGVVCLVAAAGMLWQAGMF
ncbi:helicase HerA-like domain-containing protein [Devosia sp. FJ2-5-3]|uniref:helicase HerA-like domain-containing protein n=1 Tax=Devosia sp. FJ2-5-3 TaxID=2976680 RepID=UPI0023D7E7F1|nr:helicase HerA-like domain-containing protein [Devosia sp. FJ2-5-3]WEJ60215.1 DUF853 domain-containing protein [Devosia sp. FJ2-5-3]